MRIENGRINPEEGKTAMRSDEKGNSGEGRGAILDCCCRECGAQAIEPVGAPAGEKLNGLGNPESRGGNSHKYVVFEA